MKKQKIGENQKNRGDRSQESGEKSEIRSTKFETNSNVQMTEIKNKRNSDEC